MRSEIFSRSSVSTIEFEGKGNTVEGSHSECEYPKTTSQRMALRRPSFHSEHYNMTAILQTDIL